MDLASLKHHFADFGEVRLHYVTAGSGKLLLFLHGYPEFWYAWKDQLLEFEQDFLAVAPDMRGYNLSSKPPGVEAYAIGHLVEDVRALAAHLGHERFLLAGHDWGALVAWAFAQAHPEQLERLIIINVPHPALFARELRENPAQQRASQYMRRFREPDAARDLAQRLAGDGSFLSDWVKKGYVSEADRRAYLEAWSQPDALASGMKYYLAAHLAPPEPDGAWTEPTLTLDPTSSVVKVPTLVIWGERDTALVASNLDGLEALVPDLTLHRVPDASHWVVHEKCDQVNAYIREFLRGAS
jgi:pimeloyl-ACP methyl ester carboxylesterase